MRVWILENVPEYEQGTRHGVYSSPVVAWDHLLEVVQANILRSFSVDTFEMYVGADQSVDPKDLNRGIVLVVSYRYGDQIVLTGEHVTGSSGGAPTLGEWRDLQQVAGLLRAYATEHSGFRMITGKNEPGTGRWTFKKDDDSL